MRLDPDVNLPSVEMDLDDARVCIEAQCISITKLSVVGRRRLVRTILKAFNQPSWSNREWRTRCPRAPIVRSLGPGRL